MCIGQHAIDFESMLTKLDRIGHNWAESVELRRVMLSIRKRRRHHDKLEDKLSSSASKCTKTRLDGGIVRNKCSDEGDGSNAQWQISLSEGRREEKKRESKRRAEKTKSTP